MMRVLIHARDVDASVVDDVARCVEDWFPDERSMPTDDFIDRLCEHYGNPGGWDIEELDSPAVRAIMRHARLIRQELAA